MNSNSQKEIVAVDAEFKFCIFEKEEWSVVKYKNLTDGTLFTACGNNLPKVKMTEYRLYGSWRKTDKYGLQMDVDYYEDILPNNAKGFVAYMKSLKCGIGGIKARMIYDHFGKDIWDVIEKEPQRLTSIPGVSAKSVAKLVAAIQQTHLMRDVMKLCKGQIDITPQKATKLIEIFGSKTMEVIQHHPYKLCYIRGFAFPMVDKLALMLGFDPSNKERIFSAINYVFELSGTSGNVCVPYKEYLYQLDRILNNGLKGHPVDGSIEIEALKNQIYGGLVTYTAGMLYSKNHNIEELSSVENLKRLMSAKQEADKRNVERLIVQYENENQIQLADSQVDAIRMVFDHQVSIITGGPGTGKTTIIKAILYLHQRLFQNSVPELLAPTAKAARRMTEQSGADASTVHSAIGYTGLEDILDIENRKGNELHGNLIIVDEVSMLDQFIFAGLLSKIPDGAKLVLVGDPDQLPSVGAGEVLYQLIRSKAIPVTKLSVIFRQSGENPIITNAYKINHGDPYLVYEKGKFEFYETRSDMETFEKSKALYAAYSEVYGIDNVILLCPIRRKTENHPLLNVAMLNKDLQELLNPYLPGSKQFRSKDGVFRIGDKVMQTKNTEHSKNGDTGIICDIVDEKEDDEVITKVVIEFDAGSTLSFDEEGMRSIELAYATTVHKSQGSEYQTVLLICAESQERILQQNLIYTACTRSKERCIILGQTKALYKGITDHSMKRRSTLLGDRLHKYLADKAA